MSSGLKLVFYETDVTTINVETLVGKALLKNLGDDAKFVSTKQFRIFRNPSSGKWSIEHDSSAQNETLLNGDTLTAASELNDGDEISIGNASKGIKKMPLQVQIAGEATILLTPPLVARMEEPSTSKASHLPSDLEVSSTLAHKTGALMLVWLKAVCMSLLTIAGYFLGALAGGVIGSNATLVRKGRSTFGEVILNIKDCKVRQGRSMFGEVQMTIVGEKIHRGNSSMFGEVLAHVNGDRVISGNNIFGEVIAKIDGNHVIKGNALIFGDVIANVENGGRMSAAAAAVYLLLM